MKTSKILGEGGIFLRQIELADCTDRYVEWLNDPEVNQYLEIKWVTQNIKTIRNFVTQQIENDDSILFAIMLTDSTEHIGNIKIGPIHEIYKCADISYFIGEKKYWGKGLATTAIKLVCDFASKDLRLHKIEAGTYSSAVGSQRVLEKNGFKQEGCQREHIYFDNKYIDLLRYGKMI